MGEFDLSLISEFRSRPSFYDRSSPRFKDKLYNAHEWQEISNKLGFDVSILKDRILQLRNRYNLEKRRIEQLREEDPYKTYDSPWPLYEHLHFLSDHIRARRSYKKMMPLNGSGGGQFSAGPELSNSCSNNSNLTLRHIADSAAVRGQNVTAFPNGLLTVKMEDGSEDTGDETESQNNDSEINAFETSGLIMETHSSTLPVPQQQQHHQPQLQHSQLKPQTQQHHPTISIRRLDTLRSDYADSSSTIYHKKQQLHQQQQQQYPQLQPQRRLHHTSINHSSLQNDNESAVSAAPPPLKQAQLNAREFKYSAFGNFISSSLLDLPPSTALELVEKFTSDIVRVLMENAEQEQRQQQQQQHCNDYENLH